MQFTYQAYRTLLTLLREKQHTIANYHNYAQEPRCVILRHDVDQSLSAAVRLAEIEAMEGVASTWFVLLRTDFYNVASRSSQTMLRKIQEMGHEIGLHFDEVGYGRELSRDEVVQSIIKESGILSDLLGTQVSSVSMHRPSKATLEANLEIPGIVNSYGQTFFRDFKYLSDSRCHWREPVMDIVRSGEFERLHILSHAFWYHDDEKSITESIRGFVKAATMERYHGMCENIRDMESVLWESEV